MDMTEKEQAEFLELMIRCVEIEAVRITRSVHRMKALYGQAPRLQPQG